MPCGVVPTLWVSENTHIARRRWEMRIWAALLLRVVGFNFAFRHGLACELWRNWCVKKDGHPFETDWPCLGWSRS